MIVFPIYAIAIWLAIAALRRSWIGLAIALVSALPVLILSHLCIQYVPLRAGEPRPVWLYLVAGSYAIVVAGIGLGIALAGHGRQPTDCHHCGYDLRGVGARVCPECGTARRCHACHASIANATRSRCDRCRVPFTIEPTAPATHPPAPALPRRATPRASFRRALGSIANPRS